jgi:arsenate reductase
MIVIHHNPDCGTSRNVLAIIEKAGYEHGKIIIN